MNTRYADGMAWETDPLPEWAARLAALFASKDAEIARLMDAKKQQGLITANLSDEINEKDAEIARLKAAMQSLSDDIYKWGSMSQSKSLDWIADRARDEASK